MVPLVEKAKSRVVGAIAAKALKADAGAVGDSPKKADTARAAVVNAELLDSTISSIRHGEGGIMPEYDIADSGISSVRVRVGPGGGRER
jgi:hypothetical protein